MCLELKHIPMKILCVMLVILQSFFIDAIIIHCYGSDSTTGACAPCSNCYWWILGDIIVVAFFILSFVITYKYLQYHQKFNNLHKKHMKNGLPLACVTWFIYSAFVAAKVAVIFKSGIPDRLLESDFYGPQFLKTGICLSGVVFILFAGSQHHAKEGVKERLYINSMASGVTFDVLDTVDFLDILFVNDTGFLLPFGLEEAILAIALINLIKPTFSFLVLMVNHFGATNISRELSAVNAFLSVFIVNTPFMAIRMYLWHNLSHDISVFLIKNFVLIFVGIHELYEISMEKAQETKRSDIEMNPNLITAHRPTDLLARKPHQSNSRPSSHHDSLTELNQEHITKV